MDEYAYAPRGQKIVAKRMGKRKDFNRHSIVAVHSHGSEKLLTAPLLYKSTMNTDLFITYLEKILLPLLPKGKTLIMDNASFHRNKRIREIVEYAGCFLLYLPPYSPDLNPIEKIWGVAKAKTKTLLRHGAESVYDSFKQVLCSISNYYSLRMLD